MRIFDYDKYLKIGFDLDWAKGCKNHRVKRGFAINDNGTSESITSDWESEVPDFMVGDKVVIKTWEQMKTEYGLDLGGDIKIIPRFVTNMKHLCGKVAKITNISEDFIELEFEEKPIGDRTWIYSADMIELAYPTVRGNDKEKKEVKKCKFKVGDIIIGNSKNNYNYTAKGVKCKVISHLKNNLFHDIKVKILDEDAEYNVNSEYFDLAETPKVTYTADTVEYNGQKATCQLGDKFDLEKGIMLCLLNEKGIGYREIRKLAKTAERKINHKFNTGDIVRVVDNGEQYDMYSDWFDEQKKPELKKKYSGKCLLKGKELRVVHFGEHSYFTDTMIYACEDLKGNVYLIGERGLKKAED